MPTVVPPERPKIARVEVERILVAKGLGPRTCAIVGIRGYYQDSMGEPGKNDRGVYDDCIAVIAVGSFKAFNANTDPSVFKPGVATLLPGVWWYQKGPHPLVGGYPALRQAAPVKVSRDGQEREQSGWFGINVHRGSLTKTSSLGCQTVYPPQWDEFRSAAYSAIDRSGRAQIPYVLVTEAERRQIARA